MSLTKEYKKKIENKNIKRLLLNRDNIPALERLLEKEILEYNNAELDIENKGGVKFLQKKIEKEELENLLYKIKQNVDSFLDVSNISMPKIDYQIQSIISYPAYYDPRKKKIILVRDHKIEEEDYIEIFYELCHEYVHHIQDLKLDTIYHTYNHKYNIFKEGHAYGTVRHIAKLYMEKEVNPLFILKLSAITIDHLMNTHIWICKKLKLPNDKDLSNKNLLYMILYCQTNDKKKFEDPHGFGSTFFYLQEQIHGPKVYSDAIHGKLKLD